MDPIQIVLFKLKNKIRNLKVGGQAPSEIKVGGLGPCGHPVPQPMMAVTRDIRLDETTQV